MPANDGNDGEEEIISILAGLVLKQGAHTSTGVCDSLLDRSTEFTHCLGSKLGSENLERSIIPSSRGCTSVYNDHKSVHLRILLLIFRAPPYMFVHGVHMAAKRAKVDVGHGEVLARSRLHLVAPGDVITTDIGYMRCGSCCWTVLWVIMWACCY